MLLIREDHGEGLAGHFRISKTINILQEHFYLPKMLVIVYQIISRCVIWMSFHKGLYKPLPIPFRSWEYVSMNFIMALPRTQIGNDLIMIVVEKFLKMVHFVPIHENDDSSIVAESLFQGDCSLTWGS